MCLIELIDTDEKPSQRKRRKAEECALGKMCNNRKVHKFFVGFGFTFCSSSLILSFGFMHLEKRKCFSNVHGVSLIVI